jgi:hypothetical protein
MCEELIYRVEHLQENPQRFNLSDIADGSGPLVDALLKVQHRRGQAEGEFWSRFERRGNGQTGRWKEFMVGDGLKVYGRAAEKGLE